MSLDSIKRESPVKENLYFHTHFHGRAISVSIHRALQRISSAVRKFAEMFFKQSNNISSDKKNQWFNKIDLPNKECFYGLPKIYLGMAPYCKKFYRVDLPYVTKYLSFTKEAEHANIYHDSSLPSSRISTNDVTDNQGMSVAAIEEAVNYIEKSMSCSHQNDAYTKCTK